MAGNTTNVVKGFRQVIQDLLVPELRSIKTEVEYMKKAIDANSQEIKSLRTEMTERIDANSQEIKSLRTEMTQEIKSLRTEMTERIDANSQEIKSLRTEMTGRIEKLTEITLRLVERIDTSQKYAELSERLARVEEKLNL